MRFWRRRWMLKWFVPAFAAGVLASPASARVLLSEDLGGDPARPTSSFKPVGVSQSPKVAVVPSFEDSFSWSDAGIGAIGALSIVLVAGGTVVLVRRERRPELAGA